MLCGYNFPATCIPVSLVCFDVVAVVVAVVVAATIICVGVHGIAGYMFGW